MPPRMSRAASRSIVSTLRYKGNALNPKITATVSISSSFDIKLPSGNISRYGLERPLREVSKRQLPLEKASRDLYSLIITRASLRIGEIAEKDADSVRRNILNNIKGHGADKAYNLKVHQPLKAGVKVTPMNSRVINKAIHHSNVIRLFNAEFSSKNPMVNWMGNILEGGPTQDITSTTYGKNMGKIEVKPTRSKLLRYPVYPKRLQGTRVPKVFLADVFGYHMPTAQSRYGRKHTPQEYGGWKLVGLGFKKPTNLTPGVYAVPIKRKGKNKNQPPVLIYFLREKVMIRPRAWFSGGVSVWARGAGGGRSMNKSLMEIRDAFIDSTSKVLTGLPVKRTVRKFTAETTTRRSTSSSGRSSTRLALQQIPKLKGR